jgi:hypothetical protein
MNNWIGAIILFFYFANYPICELIYPNDDYKWFKLKVAIYCAIILLAFEYKKQNNFIEKLFFSIVVNNIYLLLFCNETTYSINDVYFISIFTGIQYIKSFNFIKKWSNKL